MAMLEQSNEHEMAKHQMPSRRTCVFLPSAGANRDQLEGHHFHIGSLEKGKWSFVGKSPVKIAAERGSCL
ncbi:hypothetical protein GJ744_008700 [Endocarpon pusillum]|uniref:Uncharacterized protein n=1 Tax=Endocarpon pusillum TaxID=364733 RepID=A0A8H7AGY6_9EURO|nr:hypothetical protein GJ744_008700 [Endocarpon pusillum]